MSRKHSTLHVIVPGLLEAIPASSRQLPRGSFPTLEKFLSRSVKAESRLDFPHLLATLLGMPSSIQEDVPTAAIMAANLLGSAEVADSCWILAHPVMLKPDRDRLVLHPAELPENDSELKEVLQSLSTQFIKHFSPFFKQVLITEGQGWLCQLENDADIRTVPLINVAGRNIDVFLPEGKEAIQWHSLINEVQMLFYSLGTETYGFNSLWFEGVGRTPTKKSDNRKIMAIADSPLLTDLAKFNELSTTESLRSLQTEADSIADVIAVELSVINAIQSRSETDWFAAVGQMQALLADAEVLVRQGKFFSIKLYPLDDAVYSYERLTAYKFWKKVRSLNELSVAG